MLFGGGLELRSFAMAVPAAPRPLAMMGGAKKVLVAAPIVPVVRKTFPESWLWETVFRLVSQAGDHEI